MIVNSEGFQNRVKISRDSQKSINRKSYVEKSRTSNPNISAAKFSETNNNNCGCADDKLSDSIEQHRNTFINEQTRCSQNGMEHKASATSEHSERDKESNASRFLEFDSESVLKGIIYSEILGRPKALRRHR